MVKPDNTLKDSNKEKENYKIKMITKVHQIHLYLIELVLLLSQF